MTTIPATTDRPLLGEPVTATEKLLNAKHAELLKDIRNLQEVRDYLSANAQREADARRILSEVEAARMFEGVLNRLVTAAHDQLDEAARHSGWVPPNAPTAIADGISRSDVPTQGSPAVKIPDLVDALVGQWVHLWHPLMSPEGELGGFLVRTSEGFAVLETDSNQIIAEVPIAEIARIEKWVTGDPAKTIASGLMGPPDARQELPADEMRAAVEAEKHVSRTGNEPKVRGK